MTTSEPRWRIALDIASGGPGLRAELVSDAACVGLAGPSGAGKSTIVRSVAGVTRGVRGTLQIHGKTWLDTARGLEIPPWQRRVAWSPQDAPLFPHLDVRANLLAAAGALEKELPEVADALAIAPLLDRRPRHLSGGERHRVALGRALLADADVWLLDEPFAALDRALRSRVTRFVAEVAGRRAVSVLLVSHDREDREAFGAESWELDGGRLEKR